MALRTRPILCTLTMTALLVGPGLAMTACATKHDSPLPPAAREEGQSDFVSAPPNGSGGGRSFGSGDNAGATASDAGTAAPSTPGGSSTTTPARAVEETDLYRLAGNRLYYLNAYRGLMVFDVTDVTHPKLLGRSAIYGSPIEMIVRGNVASVVVSDWFGKMDDGTPFRGSIVRQIDATDPANMKINGEAKLGGYVSDVRVVGDVMYAVSSDYGWYYGFDDYYGGGVATPAGGGYTGPKIIVSSVAFGGGTVKQMGTQSFDGWSGVFNVTPDSILLARAETDSTPGYPMSTGRTVLQYVDISDPAGTIKLRGKIAVDGSIQGWGADNGRWNLDFADGRYAHTIGCAGASYCGGPDSHYVLATADFQNPDAPVLRSNLNIAGTSWSPTARFDSGRMYLSPQAGYWYDGTGTTKTPVQIFDINNPDAPFLAGSTDIEGAVWLFMPSGNKLFALGNEYNPSTPYYSDSKVSLRYLDVTDPTKPFVIGTSTFGDGWAWTPAAGTFKAFTKDDKQGLVVLPFSGWSAKDYAYNNGLQLIEFSDTSIKTSGTAKTKGWVERGIFVNGKLVSLSDLALSVVDYTDRANPKVVNELTLARNVIDAQPQGTTIAQLSTDWWDNDLTKSEMRVLPISDAEENKSLDSALASVTLEGYNARVFRNGDLAYVVSDVRREVPCTGGTSPSGPGTPDPSGKGTPVCYSNTQKIQVVDLAGGTAHLRGSVELPIPDGYGYYYGWGWYGCYYYDWYNGADVVQVEGDALALRRWYPTYSYAPDGTVTYDAPKHALFVVDLKNADAPTLASTAVTTDPYGWWGNMRVSGSQLYVSHYEWLEKPDPSAPAGTKYYVKYYLDPVDLSDRTNPKLGARINVPGMMVGASQTDPSIVYTIDYRWYNDDTTKNDFSVVKIVGDKAYLQGTTTIDGWVGQVFVQGNKAYASAEHYYDPSYTGPRVQLHEIDVTDPKSPIDRPSAEKKGWGWLLGVVGDRAIITSGWSGQGIDVYKLSDGSAPVFDQFVRTRGWWSNSLARQGNSLFLASGYWGVQQVNL